MQTIAMSEISDLKECALSLYPTEREQLALAVWESLEGVESFDPEGFEIARRRNAQFESGAVSPISQKEFLRRTRGEK